jgi:predicted phage terminase large subunit-like protein
MSKLLKQEWMATKEIKPHKDKVTRLMEKQSLFEQWKVFFNSNWTTDLVSQLLDFPNVLNDDLVDWLTQGLETQEEKKFLFESF